MNTTGMPVPEQSSHTGQTRDTSTAPSMIASLTIPPPRTGTTNQPQVRPLPMAKVRQLPHDASVLYGIGRIDASGRISERHIVRALGWQPGQRLDIALLARGITIRSSPNGSIVLPRTQRLVVPLAARRHCGITSGDYLLLAALPEHGIVIIHTTKVLDDMLIHHHTTTPAEQP